MAVKKLDYNGLKTLVQCIKFYISQVLSNYLPLSGGTMSGGEIEYTPNIQQADDSYTNTGFFSVNKIGTKGTYPSSNSYGQCYISREANNTAVNARYSLFETAILTNGTVTSGMYAYKNESNTTQNVFIRSVYPATSDPYIEASNHIILSSGIELY